jgi:hypothetical protein
MKKLSEEEKKEVDKLLDLLEKNIIESFDNMIVRTVINDMHKGRNDILGQIPTIGKQPLVKEKVPKSAHQLKSEAESNFPKEVASFYIGASTSNNPPMSTATGAEHSMGFSALSSQIAGTHYKDMPIQPVEFIQKNHIGFIEGNIIKYICRYKNKNGAEDLKKVMHYAELLLELEYGEDKDAART